MKPVILIAAIPMYAVQIEGLSSIILPVPGNPVVSKIGDLYALLLVQASIIEVSCNNIHDTCFVL